MTIKNIFREEIQVPDLDRAIKEANDCLGVALNMAKDNTQPIAKVSRENKEVSLIAYHRHNLQELLKLLPAQQYPDWLFVGVFPACYCYCDKRVLESRDYKEIIRLFYSPIRIEISTANMKAYPEVLELAKEQLKRFKARINEPLEVSATGQTTALSLSSGPDILIK